MDHISGVNGTYSTQSIKGRVDLARRLAAGEGYRSPQDAVEISDVGAMMSRLAEVPEIRADLVARVRAEIEAGTYETAERLERTIDRLMEDLV